MILTEDGNNPFGNIEIDTGPSYTEEMYKDTDSPPDFPWTDSPQTSHGQGNKVALCMEAEVSLQKQHLWLNGIHIQWMFANKSNTFLLFVFAKTDVGSAHASLWGNTVRIKAGAELVLPCKLPIDELVGGEQISFEWFEWKISQEGSDVYRTILQFNDEIPLQEEPTDQRFHLRRATENDCSLVISPVLLEDSGMIFEVNVLVDGVQYGLAKKFIVHVKDSLLMAAEKKFHFSRKPIIHRIHPQVTTIIQTVTVDEESLGSSQPTTENQAPVVSSEPTMKNQDLVVSSEPTMKNQDLVVSSEPTMDNQDLVVSSEPTMENQDLVVSSEPTIENQDLVVSSEPTMENQDLVVSSEPSMENQDLVVSSESTMENQDLVVSSEPTMEIQDLVVSSEPTMENQDLVVSSQPTMENQDQVVSSQPTMENQDPAPEGRMIISLLRQYDTLIYMAILLLMFLSVIGLLYCISYIRRRPKKLYMKNGMEDIEIGRFEKELTPSNSAVINMEMEKPEMDWDDFGMKSPCEFYELEEEYW
ncbi:uncharacterized protein ACMZJ9_014212 [Mantella aurantiaca]